MSVICTCSKNGGIWASLSASPGNWNSCIRISSRRGGYITGRGSSLESKGSSTCLFRTNLPCWPRSVSAWNHHVWKLDSLTHSSDRLFKVYMRLPSVFHRSLWTLRNRVLSITEQVESQEIRLVMVIGFGLSVISRPIAPSRSYPFLSSNSICLKWTRYPLFPTNCGRKGGALLSKLYRSVKTAIRYRWMRSLLACLLGLSFPSH